MIAELVRNDYAYIFSFDELHKFVQHLFSLFDVIDIEFCMLTM
jgi:hypothetical protein